MAHLVSAKIDLPLQLQLIIIYELKIKGGVGFSKGGSRGRAGDSGININEERRYIYHVYVGWKGTMGKGS